MFNNRQRDANDFTITVRLRQYDLLLGHYRPSRLAPVGDCGNRLKELVNAEC